MTSLFRQRRLLLVGTGIAALAFQLFLPTIGVAATSGLEPVQVYLVAHDETVKPGQTVHYTLTLRSQQLSARTEDVMVSIPNDMTLPLTPSGAVLRPNGFAFLSVPLAGMQEKTFTFSLNVQERIRGGNTLRVTAVMAGVSDSVTATLPAGVAIPLLVRIDDTKTSAKAGDLLTYRIVVNNNGTTALTSYDLQASLPIYSEFVDAIEGGYWTGTVVRWPRLAVAPLDSRAVTFTIRVRSDVPDGHRLLATASMKGIQATDSTMVGRQPTSSSSSSVRSVSSHSRSVRASSVSSGFTVAPVSSSRTSSWMSRFSMPWINGTSSLSVSAMSSVGSLQGMGTGSLLPTDQLGADHTHPKKTLATRLAGTGAPMAILAAFLALPLSALVISMRKNRATARL